MLSVLSGGFRRAVFHQFVQVFGFFIQVDFRPAVDNLIMSADFVGVIDDPGLFVFRKGEIDREHMLDDDVFLERIEPEFSLGVSQGEPGVAETVQPVSFFMLMPVIEEEIVEEGSPDDGRHIRFPAVLLNQVNRIISHRD